MKLLVLAVSALAVCAPAAMADEFCDDVKAMIKAGEERPAPFDSLVDPGARLQTDGSPSALAPVRLIRGLPAGASCTRHLARAADRGADGGTHNYIECFIGEEAGGVSLPGDVQGDLIRGIGTCLVPLGWRSGKVENTGTPRLRTLRVPFHAPNGIGDIVFEKEMRTTLTADGAETSARMTLKIRTLAPPPQ
jgi:hypothetical protein